MAMRQHGVDRAEELHVVALRKEKSKERQLKRIRDVRRRVANTTRIRLELELHCN